MGVPTIRPSKLILPLCPWGAGFDEVTFTSDLSLRGKDLKVQAGTITVNPGKTLNTAVASALFKTIQSPSEPETVSCSTAILKNSSGRFS